MLRILVAVALSCAAMPAFAAAVAEVGDKAVIIPWGDWLLAFLNLVMPTVVTVAAGVIVWAVRSYIPIVGLFVTDKLVTKAVQNAIDYATNATEGAIKGQQLTIPVGSAVISKGAQRFVDQVPGWMLNAAGGPTGVAEKIFRVLHLEPGSTAANTLAPVLNNIQTGKA